jgi:MYXO-CTERM domain-containing protein
MKPWIGVAGLATMFVVARPARAVGSCGSDCYQADSCDVADVQAAVDAALAASGGTVTIPDPMAGECTWGTTVSVDATQHPIAIQGQSADSTKIRVSTQAFDVNGAQGVAWGISNLGISDDTCTGACDTIVGIGGSADGWRIHHLRLATTGVFSRYFRTYSSTFGLIDHVTATASTASEFLTADFDNWPEWKKPVALGGAEAVFVEDCNIDFSDHWEGRPFDGENGGRMVVRHNTMKNQMLGSHGFDSGYGASVFSVVAYANDFTFDASDGWSRLTHFRGGTGLLYGNTFTASDATWLTSPVINLAIYRNPADSGGNESWQPCDGTQYRMCSNIDQDWTVTSGDGPYNCTTDQDCVDRNAGTSCKWKFCSVSHMELCETDGDCPSSETCTAFLDGSASDGYPCFMQPGFASEMQPYPWYEWDNTWSGGQGSSGCGSPPCNVDFGVDASQLQKNRNYFDDVPSGATLPGTCTPLEAFYDTQDNTLYRCESADTWQAYYQEFAYPHPLQNGGGGSGNVAGAGGGSGSGGASGGAAGNGAAGVGGSSGANSTPSSESDSGCGCRTAPAGDSRAALSALLVLSLVGMARRRRSGSGKE